MRTALLTTAALLAAAGPATAAWDPPARASRGPLPAHSPTVAMNDRGDAVAAWVRGAKRRQMIVVSVRAAGQPWGEPVAVSRRGRPAIDPAVTIDAQGGVAVVWRQVVRTRIALTAKGRRRQAVYVVRARQRALDSARWSRITTLSSDRQKVGEPQAGVDDMGDVLAAWHWGTGTSPKVPGFVGEMQYAELTANGTWTGPRRISRSSLCVEVRKPQVAVGSAGDAVIWWQCDLTGGRSTAIAVARPSGGGLGAEAELPFRRRGDLAADLAVGSGGRAVAISAASDGTLSWWRGDVGATLPLAELPALTTDERIDEDAGPPQIAVSGSGDALTAWTDLLGRPRAAPVAAGLGVGAPSSLGDAGEEPGAVDVALGTTDAGAVAWFADGRVSAVQRSATGMISPPTRISGSGVVAQDPPAVAADSAGDAAVLWTRDVGDRTVIERAGTSPS